jgi:hypothetical protein
MRQLLSPVLLLVIDPNNPLTATRPAGATIGAWTDGPYSTWRRFRVEVFRSQPNDGEEYGARGSLLLSASVLERLFLAGRRGKEKS